MGGQCVCGSGGSVELSINEFFDNMNLRATPIQTLVPLIKKRLIKSQIPEKKWVDLVATTLSLDLNSSSQDCYRNYFTDIYETHSTQILCLALIFLCQKDKTYAKQMFLELTKIFKLFYTIKSECGRYIFIERDKLEAIIKVYCSLISIDSIKHVCEEKKFDIKLKNEMMKNYSRDKIDAFSTKFVDESRNKIFFEEKYKKDPVINENTKEAVDLKKYVDFDYFFENRYHSLIIDREIRNEIFLTKK